MLYKVLRRKALWELGKRGPKYGKGYERKSLKGGIFDLSLGR
jgi:hypothetical protein